MKLFQFWLRLWARLMGWIKDMQPTPIENKPLGPVDNGLSRIREIQDLLDAGMSYRALTRRYGLTKVELKSLQRFNTGRFYFKPGPLLEANQTLVAERADPVTKTLSRPKEARVFYDAESAWDALEVARSKQAKRQRLMFTPGPGPVVDFTPTLN